MQKLYFILFLSLIMFGCDKIEEGVIDPYDTEFSVKKIVAPAHLEYTGPETELQTSISFSNSESILSVWVKVLSQDGTIDVTYYKAMSKSDENKYSTSIKMDQDMPNLTYTIDYFVKTAIQPEKKIASHNFTYDNKSNNVAPVISNPLFYYENESPSLIDTIKRGSNNKFILSIVVEDSNGLDDIDSVYINLFNYQDPNNVRITKIELFDDGSFNNGDEIKGDGIYSRKNFFPNDSEGDRKFEFYATDRAKSKSNIITHNFVVVK